MWQSLLKSIDRIIKLPLKHSVQLIAGSVHLGRCAGKLGSKLAKSSYIPEAPAGRLYDRTPLIFNKGDEGKGKHLLSTSN